MKKILVIRMSAIGDIVLATSFLESVKQKYPDSEIHFLIKKEFSDLVKKHPIIDKLISFDKKLGLNELFRLGRFLRSNNYDIIFDIHSVFRTRVLSLFLRKNLFMQIKKPRLRRFLLFYGYKNYFEESFSHIKMYHTLLGEDKTFPQTNLYIDQLEEDKTKQFLRENNIGNNYIAIVPGAAWSQKQWSIENYNNLIKKLIRSFNSTIVILGSTNDVICDKIIKHDKIINLKDKTSLRMAMGIVKYAQHTLGSDTGLLHISEAMGTPVTMILGPTSKETGARVTLSDSRVIENKDLWCRPCSQNGSRLCYRKEQYCMTQIDSEKVYSNVSRALTL